MELYDNLTNSEKILKEAFNYIGIKEIPGERHNPIILNWAKELGFKNYTSDEIAWCALFMNWVMYSLDLPRTKTLTAIDWLKIGVEVEYPMPGDIVVFYRKKPEDWQSHVAIYLGFDSEGDIWCLGGNQSNEVNWRSYKYKKLRGFRRIL